MDTADLAQSLLEIKERKPPTSLLAKRIERKIRLNC